MLHFEQLTAPICVLNYDLEILKWNCNCEKLFGWKESEIKHNRFPLLSPQNSQKFQMQLSRLQQNERKYFAFRVSNKIGDFFVAAIFCRALVGELRQYVLCIKILQSLNGASAIASPRSIYPIAKFCIVHGRIQFATSAFASLLHTTVREMLGKTATDLVHPGCIRYWLDFIQTKHLQCIHVILVAFDGALVYVRINRSQSSQSDGISLLVTETSCDAVECAVQGYATLPYIIRDKHGNMRLSSKMAMILDRPAHHNLLTRDEFHACIHPDDLRLWTSCHSQEHVEVVLRIVVKDGRVRYVKLHGSRRKQHMSEDMLLMATDITEQMHAEMTLNSLSSAVHQVSHGIVLCDAAGCVVYVNPAFEKLCGYSLDELEGKDLGQMLQGADSEMSQISMMKDAIAQCKSCHVQLWNYHKSGERYAVDIRMSPVLDERSICTHFVAIQSDITDIRNAKRELDKARNAALESTLLKSQFLSAMSHEIRTPMNGVMGMTGLLLDTALTPDQRIYAQTVRNCCETLMTLINDILDFSKIEAGRLTFQKMNFDVINAISDVMDLMGEAAQTKRLELVFLVGPNVPTYVCGDAGRFKQVLINLVSNAIKFTERGHVIVAVETITNTQLLRLTVRDTGIGLSEDSQCRLFKPFTQADGSTTRKFGGTGLGLAISKQLVEMMGGSIGVDSTLGHGSQFWFTVKLPAAVRADDSLAEAIRMQLHSFASHMRVLCVAEHATALTSLLQEISSWGAHVDGANCQKQALSMAHTAATRHSPYHLIIISRDTSQDYLALARAVASEHTKVMFLSSWLHKEPSSILAQHMIAANITKPFRREQLRNTVSQLFGLSHSHLLQHSHCAAITPPPIPLRILVVEDDSVNRKVAVLFIQKLGYRADAVCNGREAVEALQRVPYNIVLMDVQMPLMDGFTATKVIRALPSPACHTPIIAVTADAMTGARDRCLQEGMDDYISKPFTLEMLRTTFARWGGMHPTHSFPFFSPSSQQHNKCMSAPALHSPTDDIQRMIPTHIILPTFSDPATPRMNTPSDGSQTASKSSTPASSGSPSPRYSVHVSPPRICPALDPAVLAALRDQALVTQKNFIYLLDEFAQFLPQQFSYLTTSLNDSDWRSCEQIASEMKFEAIRMGARNLADKIATMQIQLVTRDMTELLKQHGQLEDEINRVSDAIVVEKSCVFSRCKNLLHTN